MEYTKQLIPELLSGGGEMGELIRTMDWSTSSIGHPAEWPQALRSSVSICLNSSCPLLIWWGEGHVKIYNDAYRDLIGSKHPKAMGSKGAEIWAEIWHIVGPNLQGILNNGVATKSADQLHIIERNGHEQVCYFTFDYSAIRDETGKIGGIFCAVTETTKKVFTEKHPSTQLKNLFLQAPVAICILRGKNYVIEVINERMAEMWDRSMEDVLNKPAFDVLIELRDQGFKELLDTVFFSGERFIAEELPINLKRNGKIENAFVKFIYEPLREEDGTISGVMALAHEITEQVLARKKIEESEAFNRTVLESSPDCMKIIDSEGKILFININGLSALEIDDFTTIKNKQWSTLWSDENHSIVKAAITKALSGETANFQVMNPTIKGTIKWWDVVVSPVLEESKEKKVSHIISVSRDISAQKQHVIKLQESEHRYHTMIHSSPSMILILKGKNMVIEVANDAMLKNFARGKDVVGKALLDVWPEIIEQGFGNLLHQVYSTGQPNYGYELPIYIVSKGKRELAYYTYLFQAQRNLVGDIDGVAVIANEVTPQATFNLQIKESEERFRSLADQIPMFAYIINPDKYATISYWNKTWLDYTGQTFEEAIGRAWDGIIHPDDVQVVMDIYVTAFEKRVPYYIPAIRVKRYDGVYRWHMVKNNPRFMPNGQFMGYIGVGLDIHESKLSVDALKESEERFRNLVEKAPSPICILKGERMILDVANDPVLKIWNVGKEAIGKAFLDIIPEMKDQPFMGWLLDVFHNGVTQYGYEEPAYFTRKNGEQEVLYFNFIYQPYRENDDTISGVMVLATNVTELVISRKKIEESEHSYRQFIYSSPSMIAILNGEQMIIDIANDAILKTWGKGKDVFGKPLLSVLPELIDQGYYDLFHRVYTTGEPHYGYEVPVQVMRNGKSELSYYTYVYQAQRDINNKINGVAIIATEVTPEAETNKNIKESEAQFRQVTNLMPGKITYADADGTVIYYNQAWIEYTGLSFEELINSGWDKIIYPDELVGLKILWEHSINTGNELDTEIRILNKEGEYKWHNTLIAAVKDNTGKIKMWISVTTEIQKIKEEEQRKDNFIRMVSHELKTPVTSIKGYVQILLSKISEEKQLAPLDLKSFLVRIDKLVLRLSSLITELLDLSKINTGRLELKKELFNLNELIVNAVEDIGITNPKYTIKIFHNFHSNIYGDKGRIEQAVINIITNAIKYSANIEHIIITISKANNNHVAVTVQDYGIGIDQKDHEKIFERFYRAGGKSEETYPGFGIGLFIVKEILLQHNGLITVKSEKGKGAAFTFTLPFVTDTQNNIFDNANA